MCYILVTVIIMGVCGYAVGAVVFRGPSKSLSAKLTNSMLDTNDLNFVPRVFLSEEEIALLSSAYKPGSDDSSAVEDTPGEDTAADESIPEPAPEPEPEDLGPQPDEYGFIDEDGDGIIREKFNYKGSTVYLIIVLDPSRVFTATAVQDPTQAYGYGITLADMITTYDALGGINAGGFIDVGGAGAGWPPEGITYSMGQCYNPNMGGPLAAFSGDNLMLAGHYSDSDCEVMGVRDAVSFGPVLISGGKRSSDEELKSEIGPRTAIGQRADKAVVMMAVDGRQAYSIGLTFGDCADILLEKCGCITAVNMDGGNSTCMIFDGEMVNNPSNPAGGTRNLPTAWLIRK